jgi:hypothetical protein
MGEGVNVGGTEGVGAKVDDGETGTGIGGAGCAGLDLSNINPWHEEIRKKKSRESTANFFHFID